MRWSLSSLGTYEKCPAQYKYAYIEKLPRGAQSAPAARGTQLHSDVESVLRGITKALPDEISKYDQLIQELKGQENYPEHKIALTNTWEPTEWDSADCWWRGILDLKLVTSPTEVTVIDWKTGKIYPNHDDQKSLYSIAVFAESPAVRRVRAQHIYLDLGKTREKIYDRDQMHELRSMWTTRAYKLEKETEWLPHPSFNCRYCPYSKDKAGPCRF